MNKHQVAGRIDQGLGKVKEAVGKTVGNERLQSEGLTDQLEGKAKSGYGDAKEDLKDKATKFIDRI